MLGSSPAAAGYARHRWHHEGETSLPVLMVLVGTILPALRLRQVTPGLFIAMTSLLIVDTNLGVEAKRRLPHPAAQLARTALSYQPS